MPHARRAVREHRARQLVADRRPARAEAGRLRDHRVGLRLRHGDGEVHRHRLPQRPAWPRARSSSSPPCARSSTTAASTTPAEASPAQALAAIEAGAANLERHLGIVREFGLPAVVAVNRRPEDTDEEVELVTRLATRGRRLRRRRQRRFRAGRQGRRGPGRGGGRRLRPAERVPLPLRGRGDDQGEDRGDRRAGLRRLRGRLLPRGREPDRAVHRPGARRAAGVHGEDPAVALGRPEAARRADRLQAPGPRRCAPTPARAGWCRSAATSSRCRGWARPRPPSTSTSTPMAAPWACSERGGVGCPGWPGLPTSRPQRRSPRSPPASEAHAAGVACALACATAAALVELTAAFAADRVEAADESARFRESLHAGRGAARADARRRRRGRRGLRAASARRATTKPAAWRSSAPPSRRSRSPRRRPRSPRRRPR